MKCKLFFLFSLVLFAGSFLAACKKPEQPKYVTFDLGCGRQVTTTEHSVAGPTPSENFAVMKTYVLDQQVSDQQISECVQIVMRDIARQVGMPKFYNQLETGDTRLDETVDFLSTQYNHGANPKFQDALIYIHDCEARMRHTVKIEEYSPCDIYWGDDELMRDWRGLRIARALDLKNEEKNFLKKMTSSTSDYAESSAESRMKYQLILKYRSKLEARDYAKEIIFWQLQYFGLGSVYCEDPGGCDVSVRAGQDENWQEALYWVKVIGYEKEFKTEVANLVPKVARSADYYNSKLKLHAASVMYDYLGKKDLAADYANAAKPVKQ